MRPTVSACIQFGFILLKNNFRTELSQFEKLVELPAVLPKMQAVLKLAIQTRFNPFAPVSHSPQSFRHAEGRLLIVPTSVLILMSVSL
jgi:hypothetical protein